MHGTTEIVTFTNILFLGFHIHVVLYSVSHDIVINEQHGKKGFKMYCDSFQEKSRINVIHVGNLTVSLTIY